MLFYVGLALAAAIGAFVQTLVGFGAAVAILLYLNSFMDITAAPSVSAVVCLVLNFSIFLRFRKALRIQKIIWPLIIYSAISLLVVFTIKSLKVNVLTIVFGLFLMAIAAYYLFFAKKIKAEGAGTGMMLFSSGISGLFSGLFSIGGPTLSIYYLAILGTGDAYIAGLQLSFLAANVVLCTGRIANGLLTFDMIPAILVGVAAALAGQELGKRVRDQLSTDLLVKLVYAAVGLSGLIVILQTVF